MEIKDTEKLVDIVITPRGYGEVLGLENCIAPQHIRIPNKIVFYSSKTLTT